jgi:MFS-type transporter involved in bile tolerance (Atg22 family)
MYAAIVVRAELWSNVLLIGASLAMGAWSSNHWALSQLLAGPGTAGKWTGVQNCLGNFAGVFAPVVSGFVLKATHSFFGPFAIVCGLLFIAVLAYWIVVGAPVQIFSRDGLAEQPQFTYIEDAAG